MSKSLIQGLKFSSLVILALFTVTSYATKISPYPGWFLGAQAGDGTMQIGNITDDLRTSTGGGTYHQEKPYHGSFRFSGGAIWHLDNHFSGGAEMGYAKYPGNYAYIGNWGKSSYYGSDEFIGYYADLLLNTHYVFASGFNIFDKAGIALVNQAETMKGQEADNNFFIKRRKYSKTLPEIALGIGYFLTKNVNLTLAYHRIIGQQVNTMETFRGDGATAFQPLLGRTASVDNYWLGISYQFNNPIYLRNYSDSPVKNRFSWLFNFQMGKGKMLINPINEDTRGRIIVSGGGDNYQQKQKHNYSERISGDFLWNVNNTFGVGPEMGYANYPGTDNEVGIWGDNTTGYGRDVFTGYYFDLLAAAKYSFFQHFYILSKAGVALVRQKERFAFFDVFGDSQLQQKERQIFKMLPEVALGIGANIYKGLSANFSYHHVFGQQVQPFQIINVSDTWMNRSLESKVASIDNYYLGISYEFA